MGGLSQPITPTYNLITFDNLANIMLLEAHIMAYDTRDPFVIPTLVDEFDGAAKDCWGNRAATGVFLFSHWSKFLFYV